MREHLTRRRALGALLALGLGARVGVMESRRGGHGRDHDRGEGGPTLTRFATTVAGAEFTGIFLTDDGQLFFNVQHPGEAAEDRYKPGAIGAVAGVDVTDLPSEFASVRPPEGDRPATTVRTARGRYQLLARGRDETRDGRLLGVPYTPDGTPMTEADAADSDDTDSYGNDPDFNGFVPTAPVDGERTGGDDRAAGADEGYVFTNWEDTPGLVSRLHVRQSSDAGRWRVLEKMNVDFRDVEGTWNNCFGTVSPWGTPLTSEEYEPDAAAWFDPEETGYGNPEADLHRYLGHSGNPYRYGYVVEIEEPRSEEPTPAKRFAMGRFSHENAVVMPDRKTVYLSDDGTGTVFFKFEADEAGDLSSGTLYAARADQERGDDPAEVGFELDWVELAHATDERVERWIAEYDDQDASADADYVTDEEVNAWARGEAEDDRAALLESRKAAAAAGATDEFRKMEGINVKPDARPGDYLYVSMSEANRTRLANGATEDEEFDDPQDQVHLAGNDYGTVYRMELQGDYDVCRMEPAVVGGPDANVCGGCPYDARPDAKSAVCEDCAFNPTAEDPGRGSEGAAASEGDARGVQKAAAATKSLAGRGLSNLRDSSSSVDPENAVANPDNLVVMPDGRVIVGEDSDARRPNMLWVYDPRGA